jgi:hypothetical protein
VNVLGDNGMPWGISYMQRITPATPQMGAIADIWVAPLPTEFVNTLPGYVAPVDLPVTQPLRVASGLSDHWTPGRVGGSVFLMVDERQITSSGEGHGQPERVATLQRIDGEHYKTSQRFENISNYSLYSADRMLFRQVPADQTPGIFLWDGARQRRLGDVPTPGQLDMQFAQDSGKAYFVLGNERLLSRLGKIDDAVEDVYVGVRRYSLRGDEKYAILLADKGDKLATLALDLTTGQEVLFARPNPCCWLRWDPDNQDVFNYSQSAGANAPAEYHKVDVKAGVETSLVLPESLVDLAGFLPRPDSDEVLYLDSQGHGVFFGRDEKPRRTVLKPGTDLPATMLSPSFSRDGKYLLYIDPQPITAADPYNHGPLLVQPSDLSSPPRALTTPGMVVQENSYFFINGPEIPIQGPNGPLTAPHQPILVFWGYVVRASTDLFFANHETGDLKVVSGAIGNVNVDSQRVFGTVHMSAQDVVGDLVVWDVPTQSGRTISHAVPQYEFVTGYNLVGYVARGRAASDHDGIWVTTMTDPASKQDGGPR